MVTLQKTVTQGLSAIIVQGDFITRYYIGITKDRQNRIKIASQMKLQMAVTILTD